MTYISILKPGLLTTLQDEGRRGRQQYGIPVSGAMDQYALQLANILVGNDTNEAALEITLMGPTVKFCCNTYIGLAGGDFPILLNGKAVEAYEGIRVNEGDVLSIGSAKRGCRAYLAIAGGFDVPLVMGSRATYLRGGFGGFMGRQLKEGDEIPVKASKELKGSRKIPAAMIPDYVDSYTARVILGPEAHRFTAEGIDIFLSNTYRLTNQCDRMGYRLEGPVINHTAGADIISGGINLGAIQVPGHGNPIIMMADRQTTGGYTKIANVISVDIPYLAQLRPGDTLRFKSIALETAHQMYIHQHEKISELINEFEQNNVNSRPRYYSIKVNNKHYQVMVEAL